MRSRTEQVTNTVDGSDYDDDTDFEDSEEDWRPEKGDSKVGLKRKSVDTTAAAGRRGNRNSGVAAKRGRKAVNSAPRRRSGRPRRSAGGRKSLPSDEEEEQEDSERNEEEEEDDDDDDGEDSEDDSESQDSPVSSKRGRKSMKNRASSGSTKAGKQGSRAEATSQPTAKPIQRKVVNMTQSFPDKTGILKLYAFKDDLREGIRENLKLCLWRRDGSSLLQKYFRDKSVDASTPQFTSSMVYSCWEDKRAYEYMEVKVRCIEQSKHLRVQIVDIEAVERRAKEEYREYVDKYEKQYAATTASGNDSTPSKDGDAPTDNNADTAGSQGEEEDGTGDRAANEEHNLEMGQDASEEEEEEDPPQEE
ncbi:helicase ARIP4-like [Anopheles aquasalis]|uniref:helicase ARIP4-like n=1 Tax=Anopheles aquasalis TaxID=42839 RepID=UPI00215A16C1|nr:helicase ARIP4-like [Anopheles aquasalis]XP_050083197.1 helicase ARIP4-like [Anopheles aquasalis]